MPTEALLDSAWQVAEGCSEREHLFALVDHAGCDGLLVKLEQKPSLPWINLFESTKEENAIEVAPILVDLGQVMAPAVGAKSFLRWLVEACQTTNALLLMRSERLQVELAKALQRRLDALLPDEMPVLLRYFDSRVFVSLMSVFDEKQRALFCGLSRQWWWLDRAGEPCRRHTDELPVDVMSCPIVFDDRQQAQLIDACEPDAISQQIALVAPDLCDKLSRAELHTCVGKCLSVAHGYGIDSFPMLSLFCVVALERGEFFHEQPLWRATLTSAQEQGRDFAWALRHVEEVAT